MSVANTAPASEEEVALADANIQRLIVRQALPMAIGLLITALALIADAYFVSLLGARELTAVSFASPIVMLCVSAATGFSRGVTVLVSQRLGQGDRPEAARLSASALWLVAVTGLLGVPAFLLVHTWLFSAMGAPAALVPLISEFMLAFLISTCVTTGAFVAIAALRGAGDARIPAVVFIVGAVLHVALDPLFIFGIAGFPRLGLIGVGVASACAYAIATAIALIALRRRGCSPRPSSRCRRSSRAVERS